MRNHRSAFLAFSWSGSIGRLAWPKRSSRTSGKRIATRIIRPRTFGAPHRVVAYAVAEPQDDLDVVTGRDKWHDFATRQKYPKGWDSKLTVEIECPICGSLSPDQSYVPAKVLLQSELLDQKLLVTEGFVCFVCEFLIEPTQRYLAQGHRDYLASGCQRG